MGVDRPKVLVVVGTRPETIKLAPVIEALRADRRLEPVLVATSQHREMLRQALRPFRLVPDVDLDIMTVGQTPTRVAVEVLRRFEPLLAEHRPAWVVVQGDTTTAFATAVASFYGGVKVAHVEAGLRTGRLDAPFPEEFNRRAAAVATTLHLAPTPLAAANLRAEGIDEESVLVVGNTVVDAVRRIRKIRPCPVSADPPLVLVTLHRRESFGGPIARVLGALRALAEQNTGRIRLVYPVHPNPRVDGPAREALGGVPGVELHAPLDYPEFLELFAKARFVLSDSGGIQEEGPTLGVPVLVLRDTTERPEVLESGWGKLVGTDPDLILAESTRLLRDDAALAAMKRGPNPFGDGHAAVRIATALAERT
ncbi:MAG: UDP-N-acetylglucosamine 2-epimerase (non-hydrolyzing) [Thermoanaerobaculaceae bacterium]|nr:UDP-N-acetylglucosamine 2-epimerase (non-hydrolyzing) [Thermoanaerobaculaceae bacterium]MDI9620257.1 UDP-N-acetylglucosamine 2-epimerase (non-hydrolyzing) [Acidobacteriota bacterium]NLH11237.1 UDP-N-acetylglucosamine 2-epimerase (non-hydrolyzing) [Holophagae bacterium]HPW56454.1 UDP-N-acetylglucosamine 2-epimerase (non-hydrolyzing) [Thermoanaerobaculaceae bacterium]